MSEYNTELAEKLIERIGCPCKIIPSADSADTVMKIYLSELEKGKKEGYFPLLAEINDTLLEMLDLNADDNGGAENYREELLKMELPDGKSYLDSRYDEYSGYYLEGVDEDEFFGTYGETEIFRSFTGLIEYGEEQTSPMILARVPSKNPWEVFAWIPFGGWNDCPENENHMAAAKYWYEKFGAVVGVIRHDIVEFYLEKPINSRELAIETAKEHYGYCPDVIEQGWEELYMLASCIEKSKTWYFWWD